MMQQYEEAKAACGDALLLFRMGDFYELFHEDARTAAKAVGLTLTSRDKGDNPVPMAGFPHHQLENYLGKLISGREAGGRVRSSGGSRSKAKGLVRREVTRVVSAGALTDDALLDPHASRTIMAAVVVEPLGRGGQAGRARLAANSRPVASPRRRFRAAIVWRTN